MCVIDFVADNNDEFNRIMYNNSIGDRNIYINNTLDKAIYIEINGSFEISDVVKIRFYI